MKEGIDYVFEQNPSLEKIGTKEQYEKYLETIFPESKVKDIVYHGSIDKKKLFLKNKFEKRKSKQFSYSHGGIFQTSSIDDAKTAGTGKGRYEVVPLLINLKNPGISKQGVQKRMNYDTWAFKDKKELKKIIDNTNWKENNWGYELKSDTEVLIKKPNEFKYDGIWDDTGNLILDLSSNAGFIGQINEKDVNILKNAKLDGIIAKDKFDLFGKQKVGEKTWYFTINPSQIHILGSEKDIKRFYKFVNGVNSKQDSLEKRLHLIGGLLFLLASFISIPFSLTGNVIANSSIKLTLVPVIFFFIALLEIYFSVKLKR